MKKNHKPPRWATSLVEWRYPSLIAEDIVGDMQEEFDYQVEHRGPFFARLDYIRTAISFAAPYGIKSKSPFLRTRPIMKSILRHYLIIAVRNLVRHKAFSAINIAGLALGMTCWIFIFLWVRDEKAVDNFHADGDRLYIMYLKSNIDGEWKADYITPTRRSETRVESYMDGAKSEVPGIEYVTSYSTGYELPWGHAETFQIGDKKVKLEGSRAGNDFLQMFNYPLVAGNAVTALNDISSIAISRKMASLFFNDPKDAIGKSIRFENHFDLVITAVFEDVTPQSSLKFDFLINWDLHEKKLEWANGAVTFFKFKKGTDAEEVKANIVKYYETVRTGSNLNELEKTTIGFQPVGDQHLFGKFDANGDPTSGRNGFVQIFSGIAIFILLLACINFMNLATARSVKRAREVGIRKVVGSTRLALIGQFFGESLLLSFLALLLSVALVMFFLPAFNALTMKDIEWSFLDADLALALLALMLSVGIVAGSYPALFLSSLNPARILKGVFKFTNSAISLRRGLAGFQFTLSIVLIIATIVVSSQLDFIRNTNIGYDRENLIYIRIEGDLNSKYLAFKTLAEKMPGILMVDRSSEAVHAMNFIMENPFKWEGKSEEARVGFKPSSVGFDFLKIMKMDIAEGRGFSRDIPTDTAAFMVNELAVKQMGISDPIGKWISAWQKRGTIIGVLKDYHTHSLHRPISPVIIDVKEDLYFGMVIVRIEAGKTKEALSSLEAVYKEVNPDYPFYFQFVDQEYENLYRAEEVTGRLSNVFAVVAVSISCLGLLGLVMFAAEQRFKEIGIRKVLGASVYNVISLLSRDFVTVVAVAFLMAVPVGWYLMHFWLESFQYKIELEWWIFVAAGGAALFVAMLTVSAQAIQSATDNPMNALRSE